MNGRERIIIYSINENNVNILDDPMNRDGWSSLYEKCENFRIISFQRVHSVNLWNLMLLQTSLIPLSKNVNLPIYTCIRGLMRNYKYLNIRIYEK